MRNHCVKLVEEWIKNSPSVRPFFMTGDLGFSVLENIEATLGKNFLNVGIAEANMMSLAAALAFEGRKVFTYSIIPFTTFRCLEQIRNDICYHRCDVTMIGIGVGYGYGYLGATHHAIDDLGVMTAIPNLQVYSPNDCRELSLLFPEIWKSTSPKYLRLGKGGEKIVQLPEPTKTDGAFVYGKKGARLTVFVIGTVLGEVAQAISSSQLESGEVNIVSLARVKPLPDWNELLPYCSTQALFVQEVSAAGHLHAAVYAELSKAKGCYVEFTVCTAPDAFATQVGDQQYQRSLHGLDTASIQKSVSLALAKEF